MKSAKLVSTLVIVFLLITSCSTVDKLKEKLSSDKDKGDTKEETKKEETKEVTSAADIEFYNKYIEVTNKIQDAGEKVYKDYLNDIPEANTITKSSFIIAVSFGIAVDNLERVTKEYSRSLLDGGQLSKLNASSSMKTEIEDGLKNVLREMEDYHKVSSKVASYYKSGDFKKDISSAVPYDGEMKTAYEKFKSAFDVLSGAVKKYKPQKILRDPNSISNPDERSVAVLMNSYENTLDKAEEFYEAFNGIEYKGDLSKAKEKFREFETAFENEKNTVLSAEFSEKTKYMKYSYEDYLVKMTKMFIDSGNKFFDTAPDAANVNEFNRKYDDVINNYNYVITAYNTNINVVNSFRVY